MTRNLPRWACWTGAAVDGVMVFALLIPALGGWMFNRGEINPGADYRYIADVAGALMLGWTLLLAWAARRPDVRRPVLLLTIVALAGLLLAAIAGWRSGFLPSEALMRVAILQVGLMALFGFAARVAKSGS